MDTLEFLRRSGRLTNIQFGLGSLLLIKPVIYMQDSKIALERVRTRKGALHYMLEKLENIQPLEEFAFVHTHALEKVGQFKELVTDLIPAHKGILTGEVTPVIGAHIGPGAYGFSDIAAR